MLSYISVMTLKHSIMFGILHIGMGGFYKSDAWVPPPQNNSCRVSRMEYSPQYFISACVTPMCHQY